MKDIVWIQVNNEEMFHAVERAIAYDVMEPDFETLCGLIAWSWRADDVERDVVDDEHCDICVDLV